MIIPINTEIKNYKTGDKVTLVKEISCGYAMFTVGHELVVIEKIKDYSYYTLKDEENDIIITKIFPQFFTLKTDLIETKDIYMKKKNKKKFIDFIFNNCPHRGNDSWDRDEYVSCGLMFNRSFGQNECKCKTSCINQIRQKDIDNDDFIKTYMRKLKIKEITK